MTGRFSGKIAAVTGGGSGLGEAVARGLAAEGAHVLVADRDAERARAVARGISEAGGRAVAVAADVRRSDEVRELFRCAEELGGLHVLVLAAAVEERRPLEETTDEIWQEILDVNVKGAFLCMKYGIPLLARSGGGSVVALGSPLGRIGQAGYAAYCASKGALVNLCKQAAVESAAQGVRVNVVAPGPCETGLFLRTARASGRPEAVFSSVASRIPLRRLGTERDVCEAVLFLASDAAAYVSGVVFPVDGGLAAQREA